LKVLTSCEAKRIDEFLVKDIGFTYDILIEHAAMAVANACMEILQKSGCLTVNSKVMIFAGKGMNGLDAFSCARILYSRGVNIVVYEAFPSDYTNVEEPVQRIICRNIGIEIVDAVEFTCSGDVLIIDGIFGVSFNSKREITSNILSIFESIKTSRAMGSKIVAIDIPSGVDPDSGEICSWALTADWTVTFIRPKPGIVSFPGRLNAGNIVTDCIGIPEKVIDQLIAKTVGIERHAIELIDEKFTSNHLKQRPTDGHKRMFGKIGFIGGSKGMAGSISLAALAAMRSGCGLAYVRVPDEIIADCLSVVPEALISDEYTAVFKQSEVLVIGPGMDLEENSKETLWNAIENFPKLILDANALNILSDNTQKSEYSFAKRKLLALPPVILTPHQGELNRLSPELSGCSRIESALRTAQKYESIVILKGAGTIVATPDEKVFINSTGNSSMAKGGSGDVLAGVIAAIYAREPYPEVAASVAVYIHGMAGDLAAKEMGEYSAIPSDTIRYLPQAFMKFTRQ
jgi:hydroxyethylthiazole kinase-like uncharacterized protein yjeF